MDDAATEFLPVENFPVGSGSYFDAATAVYIDKLNRIYIFGGYTDDGTRIYQDKIWYIDLHSPPVPAFDCSNLPEESYPHPTDCSSFFICYNGELAGEYTCPPPLQFAPIQQTCTKADIAQCFLSCEGKEGLYPHPTHCSKFFFCTKGIPTVEVYDCPEPLLFDHKLLRCNLPQLSNCS
jgi:hypothetical protein